MKKSCFCLLATVLLASMAKADTTATYSDVLPTTQTVLFPNANLLAVKGLSLDGYQKFGGYTDTRTYTIYEGEESTGAPSSGYYKNSSLFGYANSGTTLTVEFHGHNSYGYNGIGNGFELKLTQSENDILGEVTWMASFTGANDFLDSSWASKKKSNFNDWNSTSATYSTCGSNLTLVFRETESHTVTFVDWNGTVLDTQTVAFGADATSPAAPSRSGYVFAGWDTAFTAVTENLTVTAVYHHLFTVTFLDADGTVIDTQTVEETTAATEPDMTGRTYGGTPFSGWDADLIKPLGEQSSGQGTRWNNPEATKIIHDMAKVSPDSEESYKLGIEFLKVAVADMPFIGFHSGVKFVPSNSSVWEGYPTASNPYNGPWWWWSCFKYIAPYITPVK